MFSTLFPVYHHNNFEFKNFMFLHFIEKYLNDIACCLPYCEKCSLYEI